MNPRFPLYIPSRSRAEIALTPRFLDTIGVPYRLVVERDQYDDYAEHFDEAKLIVLDPAYQRDYDTCDEFGDSQPKGSGPARNFIWEHSIAEGHAWHWIMDDNIKLFARLHENKRVPVGDGWIFHAMETFVLRYSNVATAGPHYWMFAPSRTAKPPFTTGSRVYSCNLIRNDVGHRWRGRWNEDTILSLDVLKDGWATVLFNAFLQYKMSTQKVPGGNTENYQKHGTLVKKSDARSSPSRRRASCLALWSLAPLRGLLALARTAARSTRRLRSRAGTGLQIPYGLSCRGPSYRRLDARQIEGDDVITIQLDNVEFAVQDAPTPTGLMRLLVFQDQQSGLRFAVPLDEAGARAVAAQLSGKPAIAIANGMPPIRPAYDGH